MMQRLDAKFIEELPPGHWELGVCSFGSQGEFIVASCPEHPPRYYKGDQRVPAPIHYQWGHG